MEAKTVKSCTMRDTAIEIDEETSTSEEAEVIELSKDEQIIIERICKNLSDLMNIQKSFCGQLQYSAFYGIDLELKNIEPLKPYSYLQKIDVSNNHISDLSPLINLEHLIILNVSNNLIYELSSSYLPNTLKHADFSRNLIEEICDFQYHPKLTSLYLDYNKIRRIKGLHQCERLHSLSLAYNMISRIENLECLPLQYLNLVMYKLEAQYSSDFYFLLSLSSAFEMSAVKMKLTKRVKSIVACLKHL
eukprot:XP_014778250.1 PREDICTED: leucine-rich repeat and guanylate kinase domain-containing protein-like [Octopus bimaculoides]